MRESLLYFRLDKGGVAMKTVQDQVIDFLVEKYDVSTTDAENIVRRYDESSLEKLCRLSGDVKVFLQYTAETIAAENTLQLRPPLIITST